MADTIFTCFWYVSEAEDAARFYVDLFRTGSVGRIFRWPAGSPGPEGQVLTVEFELFGRRFMGLNGGQPAAYNNAMSQIVECDTQADIDRIWDMLLANGGAEIDCGWISDRWGVNWQIIPRRMIEWHTGPNGARTMAAMMTMKKLDIATLEAAAAGE